MMNPPRSARFLFRFLFACVTAAACLHAVAAQRSFATPADAASALHDAVRSGDRAALMSVLGPGSADVIDSGDEAEDMVGRAKFAAAYEARSRIEPRGASRADLVIGPQDWRFPFPLVKSKDGWRFDARAGRDEVIARRVGRNELAAMQASLAYVDAQREYSLARHDGTGPGIYAERIASTPERHDGLYWMPTREGPLSPLGLMFSLAAADETAGQAARPYHGYFFRVLRAQGAHATGGATDYVAGGRMIGGFALVAFPARYRVSGVRTFIVSHEGIVFSRDLGARTDALARAMLTYDPNTGWRRETATPARAEDDAVVRRLVSDRGCTLCHREGPQPREAGDAMPLAPSFREIAARYRGKPGAEEQLTHIVIDGADPSDRHWKDRIEFNRMGANAPSITPDEARSLVRWILAIP